MLAEIELHSREFSSLLATLPLWPLLGSILIGLMLATRKFREFASHVIIAGVAISALMGISTFWQMRGHAGEESHALLQRAPSGAAVGAAASTPEFRLASFVQDHTEEHDPVPIAHDEDLPEHDGAASRDHAAGHDDHHAAGVHSSQKIHFAEKTIFHWISLGTTSTGVTKWIDVNYYVDSLTGIMLVVVTFVALMVVIYASGYMRDHHGHKEVGYERFFAWLGLFVFSMLMLVLAGNFVLLYLGWEAVGLCSYLLIGFYYQKPEAAAAAKKAFLVNRIGDFGFALGIFALWHALSPLVAPGENPLDYTTLFAHVHELDSQTVLGIHAPTLICLLLLCGALGKSAQFPLYVWLPDAMEGPSPVSALIHAATMVTAGVYMVARLGPLFALSPFTLDVILVIGLIGAVLAATMAMAQYDMKRILAYSTMSQLAFMFCALGAGVPQAAIFHLFTHAFFKALLFLTAGSVMHSMGNIIDLRYFSGLKKVMPQTYWLMLIGCLALAGAPLLAGFWSKDEIVHGVLEHNFTAGVILLITAFLTAYYTFRMFFMCFHGETRTPAEAGDHPHDSPPIMNGPLVPLAIGAVAAGWIGIGGHDSWLHHYFDTSSMFATNHGNSLSVMTLMIVSGVIALAGIGLAFLRYGTAPRQDPDRKILGGIWQLWHDKYYVDELYNAVFVEPLRGLGRVLFGVDKAGVDGVVNTTGRLPVFLGGSMRGLQRGAVQGYALGMVIGIGVLFIVWKWWSQ
ncbi:MAG: NADH-quinone oxidoreductase subunit L [Phycisphaerae bacterium]